MTVNDYDLYAARRQQEFRNGQSKPHRFVEKPAMKSILPDLTGNVFYWSGCGTAEEATMLEDAGAATIVGIDLSEKSIELARQAFPEHQFSVADMHSLPFEDGSFDFIYSSLTVHYSSHPLDVYREIFRVLRPGGQLQFSVGHPVRWASRGVTLNDAAARVLGWTEDDSPQQVFGNYSEFAEQTETFPLVRPLILGWPTKSPFPTPHGSGVRSK